MFEIEIIRDSTETKFNRNGSTYRVRTVAFFLGRYGPYTEEWPVEEFTEHDFNVRAEKIRQQLRTMGAT